MSAKLLGPSGQPVTQSPVVLLGTVPGHGTIPLARGLTDSRGRFATTVVSTAVDLHVSYGWPPRTRPLPDSATSNVRLGVIQLVASMPPPEEHTLRGRVESPDGAPVWHALVVASLVGEHGDPAAFARTDRDGAFDLTWRGERIRGLVIHAFGRRWNAGAPDGPDHVKTFRLHDLVSRELAHRGTSEARYHVHDGMGWIRLVANRVWLTPGGRELLVRARVPNHVPRVRAVRGERRNDPLLDDQVSFSFVDDRPRLLRVVDEHGHPHKGRVDLIEGRVFLATYETNAAGILELFASPQRTLEAIVHAPGCASVAVTWRREGRTVRVRPRRAHATFADLEGIAEVRIHEPGAHRPDAILRVGGERVARRGLASGPYDVSFLAGDGHCVRAQRVHIEEGEGHFVRGADQRAVVEVHLPELETGLGPFEVLGTHVASRSTLDRVLELEDAERGRLGMAMPVAIETVSPRHVRLTFPAFGDHVVIVRARGLEAWFEREVHLEPNRVVHLELGPLEAALRHGLARDVAPGDEPAIAGPRLFLRRLTRSDEAEGFDVFVPVPHVERRSAARRSSGFTVRHLPTGSYRVHAHRMRNGTVFPTYGGIPLDLTSGRAASLAEARTPATHELDVQFVHDEGIDLEYATLSIRDRLHETWHRIEEGESSFDVPSPTLPSPERVRVTNGLAHLVAVRDGRIECTLELDDGRRFRFERDVAGEHLVVTLPRSP
ncbi:MAG: carboxypeptidase regulatory-like domain-containing protein [Planctomycetes bacterium]|nr:carboxypeptidase regulatory-like domain-containing protein [Planctomycetota bacterium]